MNENPRGESNGGDFEPMDDEVFSALESRRRRYALYVLTVHESISAAELADVVTGWTHVDDSGMVSRERWEEVYLSLVHRHLPALEGAGLVTWDGETDTVSRTDWSERVATLVGLALEEEVGST